MLGEPGEEEARERVGRALPQPEARLVSLGTGRAGRLGTQSAEAAAAAAHSARSKKESGDKG